MEMIKKLFKLSKALLRLGEISTDKAVLIYEGELIEGTEIFVEKDGELVPAEDGDYETETQIITVTEGKVTNIVDKEVEEKPETKPEENLADEENDEPTTEDVTDEKDARIAELEAKVAELEGIIAERDERIAELEAKINESVEMSKNTKPAFEEVEDVKFEDLSITEKIARLKK